MATIIPYVNVQDAAAIVGVTPRRVRQMLEDGTLDGWKVNQHAWLVSVKSAEKAAREVPVTGRPRSG